DSGWVGLVPFEEMPFEEMPFEENPAAGFIATANDPVPGVGNRRSGVGNRETNVFSAPAPDTRLRNPEFGEDFCDIYRAQAIREALEAGDEWTVAGCLALQRDVRSIPWEQVRGIVLSLEPTEVEARDGLELLRAWNGQVDADSAAACVFELFTAEM